MIIHLAQALKGSWPALNVVHYVTFRALMGLLTTLISSFMFGNRFIRFSQKSFRSQIREHTPEHHQAKGNMPTMGGVFIMGVVIFNILLWCRWDDPLVWIFLFNLIGFAGIGAWDDWLKITHKRGIKAREKFTLQCSIALLTVLAWSMTSYFSTTVTFPFFKSFQPDFGLLFIPWAIFIIVGSSNAVNLTDGLDGLAINSLMPNFLTFAAICYVAGNVKIASYLHIPFAGTAEIAIIGTILFGAAVGFLWYNTYPAQIFMGDVGSLGLGAALALMALFAKQELLLALAGGLFVVEALSVILQVLSFRLFKKRMFKMAPVHHHFELIGWQESQITVRFGIVTLILCILTLISLKIR